MKNLTRLIPLTSLVRWEEYCLVQKFCYAICNVMYVLEPQEWRGELGKVFRESVKKYKD